MVTAHKGLNHIVFTHKDMAQTTCPRHQDMVFISAHQGMINVTLMVSANQGMTLQSCTVRSGWWADI